MDPAADGWRNGIEGRPRGRSKDYRANTLVSVSCCKERPADQRCKTESLGTQWHPMRLSWPEHLQTARALELSGEEQRGSALALMGVALLLLAQDLLAHELEQKTSAP
jgi:hypothetical protein